MQHRHPVLPIQMTHLSDEPKMARKCAMNRLSHGMLFLKLSFLAILPPNVKSDTLFNLCRNAIYTARKTLLFTNET